MNSRIGDYGVVIPAWNAAATLGEALESVFCQSYSPRDVVVVDDGSSDDTSAVAASFGGKVRLIRQENAGPGSATSAGLRSLATPLAATLDADDIWLKDKCERQLELLRQQPHLSLLFCRMRRFRHGTPDDGSGAVQDGWSRSTMMLRREVIDQIGDIVDPPGRRGELVDWIVRAREAGLAMHMLPDVLCLRRIIQGSLSSNRDPEKDRGYLHVARMAILRRRQRR